MPPLPFHNCLFFILHPSLFVHLLVLVHDPTTQQQQQGDTEQQQQWRRQRRRRRRGRQRRGQTPTVVPALREMTGGKFAKTTCCALSSVAVGMIKMLILPGLLPHLPVLPQTTLFLPHHPSVHFFYSTWTVKFKRHRFRISFQLRSDHCPSMGQQWHVVGWVWTWLFMWCILQYTFNMGGKFLHQGLSCIGQYEKHCVFRKKPFNCLFE